MAFWHRRGLLWRVGWSEAVDTLIWPSLASTLAAALHPGGFLYALPWGLQIWGTSALVAVLLCGGAFPRGLLGALAAGVLTSVVQVVGIVLIAVWYRNGEIALVAPLYVYLAGPTVAAAFLCWVLRSAWQDYRERRAGMGYTPDHR